MKTQPLPNGRRTLDLVVNAPLSECVLALNTVDRQVVDGPDWRVIKTETHPVNPNQVSFKVTHWLEGGRDASGKVRSSGKVTEFEGTMHFDPDHETTTIYGSMTYPASNVVALYLLSAMFFWELYAYSYGGNTAVTEVQQILSIMIILGWVVSQSWLMLRDEEKAQALDPIWLIKNAMSARVIRVPSV